MVAGAAAVIRGAWPFLTAAQTANILLNSADRSFSEYNSTIYGQGILDLDAAVKAQGQNNFAYGSSVSSFGYDVRDSLLTSDPIFGDAFLLNVAPQLSSAVFFDDYGRDYKAFIDKKISQRTTSNIAENLSYIAFNNYNTQTIPINFGQTSSSQLKFQVRSYSNSSAPNQFGLKFLVADKSKEDKTITNASGFSFAQNFNNNFSDSFKVGFAINRDELSNLRGDKFNNFGFISLNNFSANPFQSFVSSSITSSLTSNIDRRYNQFFASTKFFDKKFALNFSQQSSYDSDSLFSKMGNLQNRISDLHSSYNFSDKTNLAVSLGKMTEFNNNFLNSQTSGAFSASGNAQTSYFKISVVQKLFSSFYLISALAEGSTAAQGNNLGIFRDYSKIKSRSSSVGLVNENIFAGKLGIVYSEPLRVYSVKLHI